MHTALLRELEKLELIPHIDTHVLSLFKKRLLDDKRVVREQGITDHFCAFCVPINKEKKQIYIGHHKKSNSWIPPAGHIDLDETPLDAAKREFTEELGYTLTTESIELFDITRIVLKNPRPQCTIHNDIWYLIHTDIIPFTFDKDEFYEANWYSIEDAIYKVERKEYNNVIKKIKDKMYA